MEMEFGQINVPCSETQLERIRELMLASSSRGEWLTLSEIAVETEFGEASISAQLRHLRKPQHGRHRVEKRRRQLDASKALAEECTFGGGGLWEYQVFPVGLRNGSDSLLRGYETQSAQSCGEAK